MKILIITNPSYCYFGYSVVAKHVAKGLKELGHEVWIQSTLNIGNLVRDENGIPNVPMYFHMYGQYALKNYIKGFGIDCVITLLDTWKPEAWDLPDISHKEKIPIIGHVTARSYPLDNLWCNYLQKVDHIVIPTQWGKEMVEEKFPNKCSYVQHGVDLDNFKVNKKSRNELRKELGYKDKFVFLAVGRNKELQKRYARLMKAFKSMILNIPELKEKAILHIHANEHESFNMEEFRDMGFMELKDKVVFSRVKWDGKKLVICKDDNPRAMKLNPHWGLDPKEMAKLYNMADVYVGAAEGESFSLPALEAQACGLPCVVPDHSAFQEIVGKPESGIVCKTCTEKTGTTNTDTWLVDMESLAKGMYKMWNDKDLRKLCSENAIKNAKNYDWKGVVNKWAYVIEKVCEPKPIVFENKVANLGI